MVVRTTAVPDTNSYNETKPKPVVIENPSKCFKVLIMITLSD